MGDQHELARLLCGRALLSLAGARPEEGRRDLTEASALAVAVGAGADSELGQALAKARAAQEAA